MKFIKEEVRNGNHNRYLFALGKAEAEILYDLLLNAYVHTPKLKGWHQDLQRIVDMKRKIGESLSQFEAKDD